MIALPVEVAALKMKTNWTFTKWRTTLINNNNNFSISTT